MAKGFVGVDFGSRYLHSIGVQKRLREVVINDYLLLSMPEGAYESLFKDRQTPESDTSPDKPDALSSLYSVIEPEWLCGKEGIFTALPEELLSYRVLDLPFIQPKKVAQLVGFEAEGHLPFTIDEILVEYYPLCTYNGTTEVMISALNREIFSQLLSNLDWLGLDPGALTAEGLCFQHLSSLDPSLSETCHAYLDLGSRKTVLCVVHGGRPQLVRSISMGGDYLTRALMKEFGLSFEKAEAGKINEGLVCINPDDEHNPDRRRIASVLTDAFSPLFKQIQLALMYMERYQGARTIEVPPIERIILTGGTANLPGLPELIHEHLGIPAEVFHIPQEMIYTDDLPDSAHPQLAESLALALQGAMPGGRPALNFRKGEFAYKRETRMFRRSLALPAVLLVCLIASFVLWSLSRGSRADTELQRVRGAMIEAFQEKFPGSAAPNPLEQIRQKLLQAKTKSEKYSSLNTPPALDVWAAISAKVPESVSVKLDKFQYNEDKVRIEGKVTEYKDAKAIADYVKTIPFIKKVDLEDTRSLRDGEIHFAIQIRLNETEYTK